MRTSSRPAIFTALVFLTLTLQGAQVATAAVEQVISGLIDPVRLVAPSGDPRLFVVERPGLVRIFSQSGTAIGTFLDINLQTNPSGERGLLGLAFPPDYATTGRFYISYTNLSGDTRIARFTVDSANPDLADASSQEDILAVDQPFSNHNGGHIEFGPDGYLYLGLGDGGSFDDPGNRAQNDQLLLGKMLRLDVSTPTGYAIPPTNPFVGESPRDEIWAQGLRNPWCFAFDQATGDLYIGDVGQDLKEEVNMQPADEVEGLNYGWRLMEGEDCFNPSSNCNDGSLILPIHTYTHGGNPFRCSISGGYVYRGNNLPSFDGRYFFSDYCSNQIWSLDWTEAGGVGTVIDHSADMTPPGGFGNVAAFGQDGLGELYILDLTLGKVFRITSAVAETQPVAAVPTLYQNVPNPFNPSTNISFNVGANDARVSLEIYDLAGRLVRNLVDQELAAGPHSFPWNGTDDRGRRVESGVYLYRLTLDGLATTRKMTLLE
jgi:glucose/arabinose dehydrogenase